MKMQNKKRGFTIVELVIVIAVIAILAGVLVPTFTGIVKKAQISAAQQEATSTYHAILGATEFAELDEADGTIPDAYFVVNNDKYYVTLTDGELSDPVEIKTATPLPENVKTDITTLDGLTVGTYYVPAKLLTDVFDFEEGENYPVYVYYEVKA